jgi:Tfp pilus assembly protein PilX
MKHKYIRKKHSQRSRGVALVTTLLLLSLFTVMTLAMVIATTSDTLITGYYRNFRGSFYAADSGLNASRQYLLSQFQNLSVPAGYDPASGTAPFSSATVATIASGLKNSSTGFGSYQTVDGSQSSWTEQFEVNTNAANTYINAPGAPTPNVVGTTTTYTFYYPYQITVIGQSAANLQNTVVESGTLNVAIPVVNTTTTGTKTSFAAWGTLFNTYPICGSPFVTGTMTGPFFSNDSWNFGDSGLVGNGSYIFTGSVGAVNANVGYMYSDGTCHQSSAKSDSETVTTTSGSGRHRTTTTTTTTITPQFQGGLNLNQAAVPLPTDTFNQEQAVLDGIGACASSPCTVSQATMNADHLTNAEGTLWPATGTQPSSGVYIPYTQQSGGGCPCTFTGGGIYVQGNATQVTLTASTSSVATGSHPQQVFSIKQGTVTTTVTLDLTSQTTTITDNSKSPNPTVTISGLPENYTSSPTSEGAMLYVNGSICSDCNEGTTDGTTTGLSGPSSGAAIQNGSAVTVTATGNIAVTGSITYSTEPVTLTQSGSTPADTLVTSPSTPTNVLGIYTSGGDIQLKPQTNGNNMEIDASLAMIQNGGSGGLIAEWDTINQLTIVGGRIANNAKSGASLSSRNIWFDQRFGSGGFAPPWFPSTTLGATSVTTSAVGTPTVTASRQSWVNTTAQ